MTLRNLLIYGFLLFILVSENEVATRYDLQGLTLIPILILGYFVIEKYAPRE